MNLLHLLHFESPRRGRKHFEPLPPAPCNPWPQRRRWWRTHRWLLYLRCTSCCTSKKRINPLQTGPCCTLYLKSPHWRGRNIFGQVPVTRHPTLGTRHSALPASILNQSGVFRTNPNLSEPQVNEIALLDTRLSSDPGRSRQVRTTKSANRLEFLSG
jgi:hypothetical protein